METVAHRGRTTAYRRADPSGSAETADNRGMGANNRGKGAILYVHGSGGTHRVWAAQYAPAGPVHPAVAVDLSGHGESEDVDTDPGTETLDAYADDVVAVARETGAQVLVGSSLGGAVTLHVALERDFDPDAVVLAGTGAKLAVLDELREALTDDFEAAIDFLHGPDGLFHDADERTVARSRAAMREAGRRVTRRDFLTCHRFDVRDRLSEIETRALAAVGERDSLTPPAYHEYLARNLPDCEYAEIPGAAHLAMAEQPAAFNGAVTRFLG